MYLIDTAEPHDVLLFTAKVKNFYAFFFYHEWLIEILPRECFNSFSLSFTGKSFREINNLCNTFYVNLVCFLF